MNKMSTPSFIATLTNKVTSGDAVQLGMTRQNTSNPVESTSSFDIYGRPSALSTNYRETVGMDPMYRMCTEHSVSRPQYSYYLNPSLGLNVEEGESNAPHYITVSTADQLTGTHLGRHTQGGKKVSAAVSATQDNSVENQDINFDALLLQTRNRFNA
jgi:hypothetical protein